MSDAYWHYARAGTRQGPVSMAQLQQLAVTGGLLPMDLVWRPGMGQWAAAGSVPGLFHAPPPPPAIGAPATPVGYYGVAPYPPVQQPDIGQDAGMRMLLPVGRSGWAITAGYLGLFSFIIFPAPIALIISLVAITDIRKHPEKHGMGRAIFGLVMGILGTVLLIIMLIAIATRSY